MSTQAPGAITASRITVLADSTVAEAILAERTAAYGETLREAYARMHRDGAWSAWQLVTGNASDVSIAPDFGQQEPAAALISVLIWVPVPGGGIAANHAPHRSVFYRLTASGVASADL